MARLTEEDLHLFNEGTHQRLGDVLGAHLEAGGCWFAVWAPDAQRVAVIGDWNGWNRHAHPLLPRGSSGIWEGFIPGVRKGQVYKYHLTSRQHGYEVEKADPCASCAEVRPKTGSLVWDLDYTWRDAEWLQARARHNTRTAPISIYELHLGSWRRKPEEGNRPLTYRELAQELPAHVTELGFTHVEFLPVMEHPFDLSWGYQTTGYFAPTSRFGTPQDLMHLIDTLHAHGIGVILDWVPSHFPCDQHGLAFFDGEHLYEHADPKQGFHPDWKSSIFNYGRHEVRAFLISSALHWLEHYHADGLRVDAVASMLYRDYSRPAGEWVPNVHGGRENLEAIGFLRQLNAAIHARFPTALTFAEESTAFPQVSHPEAQGGLGFDFKWDMGWLHDTLRYLARDPVHRCHHQNELTFRSLYAFSESYVLPLSHDEVVHGKSSLLHKLPGDDWQKFANLRALYGYMFAQTGKKLLFMGAEFAQRDEWKCEQSLDWHLLQWPPHRGVSRWVADLNRLYRAERALHELDCDPVGFAWIACEDATQSVFVIERRTEGARPVVIVLNFTPVPRTNYRIGVPATGRWRELLNSDASEYGGSGHGNLGALEAAPIPYHGRTHSLMVTLPPLGVVWLAPDRAPAAS